MSLCDYKSMKQQCRHPKLIDKHNYNIFEQLGALVTAICIGCCLNNGGIGAVKWDPQQPCHLKCTCLLLF
eukprot:scaffold54995_cov70-Cyclotella_meneghiniana.AAC.1